MGRTKPKIAIIGAGEIGSALGVLLRPQAKVMFWDKNPRRMPRPCSLKEVIEKAELVFLCVPSVAVVPAARAVKEYLPRSCPLIALTKGLIPPRGETVSRVLRRELRQSPFGLLAGPMLAEELLKGKPGGAVLASRSTLPWRRLRPLLRGSKLKVVPSRDEQGVALAGVLKNVYAIALGITDALHLGANARGILVQKALVEMLLIVRRLGGTTQTVYSLAGVGDLVATGTSLFSSNCILGRALVRDAKKASSLDSEGIRSFAMLWRRVSIYRSSLPLLAALAEVVVRGKSARQVWPKLFAVGE